MDRKSKHKRRGRTQSRTNNAIEQLPWKQPRNPYPPFEIVSADQIEEIHLASLRILEEVGIAFLDEEALDILKESGAEIERSTKMVKFAPELIEEYLKKAPSQFTLHSRNPVHNLEVGKDWNIFSMVASPPNCSDIDKGRRAGNFEDFQNLVRLSQHFNTIHMTGGYAVEPVDLPANTRHLDCALAHLLLTDKVFGAYSLGRQRISDTIDMICISRGIKRDQLKTQPSLISIINTSSPLRVDGVMIQGMLEMVRNGQSICVTPFTLSGAMAPVTLAGALSLQNAEALATLAFTQMVAPGSPVVYGGFTSNVDMKSGAPAFGTPELAKSTLIGGQLARRYGLPYRASNVNACNIVDAQAGYESMMSLWPTILSHCNLVKHAAGWMEGGLCASFEKVIVDVELLQMMSSFLEQLSFSGEEMAFDAIAEVGPGGHFFGTQHTLERYEKAFYAPILSDWSNFGMWEEKGTKTAFQRANHIWKQALEEYQQPTLEESRLEALESFVSKRKENPGIPNH